MTQRPTRPIQEKGIYVDPKTRSHDWDANGDYSNIIVQLILFPVVMPFILIKRLFCK